MPTRFRLAELLSRPPEEGGMSQSELARRSKVSLVTINSIANNRTRRVDLDTLDALAKALDVEPGDLLEREPARKRSR
jgi:DNA-binding Xre family transcriptional regulator